MAGIVAGVGMVAAMSFAGATPETSSTVDSFIGGLPSFLAQLNLGIVALVVNLIVMAGVSALTRGSAAGAARGALRARRAGGVERFAVDVAEAVLEDLRRRLDATRWPDDGARRLRARRGARAGGVLARRVRLARGRGRAELASSSSSSTTCTASPRATARRCCCCTAGRRACGSSTG